MVNIKFLPQNKIVKAYTNVSLLEIARENGIDIPSQCEEGSCYTCVVSIEKGQDLLIENLGDDIFDINHSAKTILSCISEIKKDTIEGEIIINLDGYFNE